jgi:hypothetical protein
MIIKQLYRTLGEQNLTLPHFALIAWKVLSGLFRRFSPVLACPHLLDPCALGSIRGFPTTARPGVMDLLR